MSGKACQDFCRGLSQLSLVFVYEGAGCHYFISAFRGGGGGGG